MPRRARCRSSTAGEAPAATQYAPGARLRCRSSTAGEAPAATRVFAPLRGSVAAWLRGFTIVELIVVITVIVLILAIAVPGLSAMNAQARLVSAEQTINGLTVRAYYLSLADRTMTAVRFFPGQWDIADTSEKQSQVGRQHLAVYSYVGTTVQELDPPGSGQYAVKLGEYFERSKELASVSMPEDVWAAPLEALRAAGGFRHTNGTVTMYDGQGDNNLGRRFVLSGQPGTFALNADPSGGDGASFLNADDFLIVCDAESGVRGGIPQPFLLRAYVPSAYGGTYAGYENQGDARHNCAYQRYNFTGVVTYHREPFTALGPAAAGQERQNLLRQSGRAYMVHRFSGGLLAGMQRPQ